MKKQLIIGYWVALSILSAFSCGEKENCHFGFDLKNNSSRAICIRMAVSPTDFTDIKSLGRPYSPNSTNNSSECLEIGQTKSYGTNGECIETYRGSTNNQVYVFIFDKETLATTPWDTVTANNLYLSRYVYSVEQLRNREWFLTYPE